MHDLILGIDISKLDLSVSLLIDKHHYQTKIDNSQEGFKKLAEWLRKHKAIKVHACMEATGTYGRSVADFLFNNNHTVSIVNPLCISAFAKSKLSRHKTDKIDSKIIAEYASIHDLPLYSPKDKALQELQDLYRCLKKLKDQRNQIKNYLESRDHLPYSVCESYDNLLEKFDQEIKTIELKINHVIINNDNLNQQVNNIETIIGIGKLTAVAIIAESPDLKEFASARDLAAYAGLTPKHKSSGTSVKGKSRISKMGSSRLRQALYFPAITAKNHNPVFIKFAQKLGSKGKPNKVIIAAIMRKLLHIVFGVVKNNTPFDPDFLLDS